MIRHKTTMQGSGSLKNTTWVWYEGTTEELLILRRDAIARFGKDVQVGNIDQIQHHGPVDTQFQLPFVFQDANKAMMFKLSN